MVLIIFIAEIAAAVVALAYTGLVSGISESWVELSWDLSYPLGKQETLGGWHCCPWMGTLRGGHCCRRKACWSLLAPAVWAGWGGLAGMKVAGTRSPIALKKLGFGTSIRLGLTPLPL